MKPRYFFSTLTRIADLETRPFQVQPLPKTDWATGDYVVGQVQTAKGPLAKVELATGRLAQQMEGDLVVGALGVRKATLEAVGDWQSIQPDGLMHNLTVAGLFGRLTSASYLMPQFPMLHYEGHVMRREQKICMSDFVPPAPLLPYTCPTILIIGTSMSAGKTTTARVMIHLLKQLDLKVVGAKLTGAGRYRDILAMLDAGSDRIFDFVDVGLPSSICPPEDFRQSIRQLLSLIEAEQPDVVVAEAGASPHEPYNGSVAIEILSDRIKCTVLCASDPYAVVGVSQSFGIQPDVVAGIATSTTAGVELVEKLTGVKALNLAEHSTHMELLALLKTQLGL
ncbi:hypothetical protein [Vacuolonema iberomarrocanum]|uniref:hypothetical protein n=1 Tax=Vacuolonema iberomarrocanum TaxID=3454632 RepID=UPI0019E3B677|nr:hypothetical protein [filamentous cyanobacterium LEGE 07170]